jgi:type I restriction enzyme S subunit
MSKPTFEEQAIGTIFRLNGRSVFPALSPNIDFHHHSLPAWDETGGPVIEQGLNIESNKTQIDAPTVLVSKLNPRKPRVAVANPLEGERHCASTEFMCFSPRDKNEDLRYWAYYFGSTEFATRLQRVAVGSTNSHTRANPTEVLTWAVPTPPSEQKCAIADVLDVLDTTIRQTQALIAKLKLVKQGLLHDLLTRGIAANGELRPPHSEAPHLYKASPLGLIPKEWTINSLDSVAEVLDPNPSHRNPIYIEQGFPFISTVEFLDTDEVETDTPRRVAESTVIDQERICAFGAWSIGFSRKGTIGETRFLPTGIRFALLDSLCVINAKSQVIPSFLMHSLRGRSIQHQIKLATMGVALPQLSIGRVRELLVLTPSIDEQQRVAQPIDEVVEKIGCEMGLLRKFQRTKSGLMDDLLTGRVRVTPLLAQAQATQP